MLIRWLRKKWTDATVLAAVQKGYRTGFSQGQMDIELEKALMLQEAATEGTRMVSQARDKVKDIERKAQRRGYRRGHGEGMRKGAEEASVTALDEARRTALAHFGIVVPEAEPAEMIPQQEFDALRSTVDDHRPNIYKFQHCWTVRIVIDGELRHEVFPIVTPERGNRTPVENRKRLQDATATALLHAIHYRNSFADDFQSYWHLWQECVIATAVTAAPGVHSPDQHMYRAAMEFYQRRKHTTGTIVHTEVPGWFGDDPEDRFGVENTHLLNMPWTSLFETVSVRLSNTFQNLGLGSPHNPRTVRDLLLLTPSELLAAHNFGQVSLDNLRQGLAEYGLALWGDDVPSPPTEPRVPGEREFRRIMLDDPDEEN